MGKNIKINNAEPCLCGSGIKFKECCKRKMFNISMPYSDEILSNPQRVNAIIQKRMDETDFKVCMYPDKSRCKLPIKNAHALQNNGVLSTIAESDHVMITDVLNKVRTGSEIKRVSKNKATTFYGFCEYHDSVLFQDIEIREYNNEAKQNFLYAYRVVAQEYHKKQRGLISLQNCIRDNPSILQNPITVENYRMTDLSRYDVERMMEIFNNAYLDGEYDILYNYVYKFSAKYHFAVTTTFVPAATLDGKRLVDIYSKEKERLPSVFFTVIPNGNSTYFIASCLQKDYVRIHSYFEEIENLDEKQLMNFLNWTLPTYSENIVLSPCLWGKWNRRAKKQYEERIAGMCGDFEKILNGQEPFETIEEFEAAMEANMGIINMKERPRYDLFLL